MKNLAHAASIKDASSVTPLPGTVHLGYGYIDQGERAIIENALDTGAFDTFALSDATIGPALLDYLGEALATSFGQYPGNESDGQVMFTEQFAAAGGDPSVSFTAEAYDAAALMLFAMQAANSTESSN